MKLAYRHEFDNMPTSEPCSGADTCPDCLDVQRQTREILCGDCCYPIDKCYHGQERNYA